MATPITWRNVNINTGADSASLGNAAAGFGRAAQSGFDTLNTQLQDRIDREDTLLTNEAIAQALRGGPTVSNNRRVDASQLQLAVERQRQGERLQEGHESDLQTAVLSREGMGIENERNAFLRDNQQLILDSEQALRDAQTKNYDVRTEASKLEVSQRRRELNEAVAFDKNYSQYMDYMTNGREQELRARFDEEADKTPGFELLSPEQQEQAFRAKRELYLKELESDPNYSIQTARRFGMTPKQYYEQTYEGKEDLMARQAVMQAEAAEAIAQGKLDTATRTAAQKVVQNNDMSVAVPDSGAPGGWTFRAGAPKISDKSAEVYARELNIDPEDHEELIKSIQVNFPTEAAFRQVLSSVIVDGKVTDNPEDIVEEARRLVNMAADAHLNPGTEILGNAEGDLGKFVAAYVGKPGEEGSPLAGPNEFQNPVVQGSAPSAGETLSNEQVSQALANPQPLIDQTRTQVSEEAAESLQTLLAELETGNRGGGNIPLSSQQLQRKRAELDLLLRKLQNAAEEEPSQPIPVGINIGIQPK